MVKGDDAVIRKKNKSIRKKMRSSQNAVSARVASIIATKRRRKAGKRRKCEGMCFSLPTVDDPFNDRNDPKARKVNNTKDSLLKSKIDNDGQYQMIDTSGLKPFAGQGQGSSRKICNLNDVSDTGPSKFLIRCLEAIKKSWTQGDESNPCQSEPFLFSNWGIDFWNKFSGGSDIMEMGGDSASKEQVAWVISTASDIITRKEKEGTIITTPFLIYIVPSQNKATEIRSICKPLRSLGIHTVSLHPGALLDHQARGLKSCEPEFIISTPERLLELIEIKAVDVSRASMLVLDGVKGLLSSGFADILISIKKCIRGNYQTIVFSHGSNKEATSLLSSL